MKNVLRILLLAGSCIAAWPALSKVVGEPAPGIIELTIESYGKRMSGLAYLASGAGPH
ncbi:MAG: hypothetical protein HKN85_10295, partial [Gammaproteobacteria bacterium]|nr:hypothetical protein [Gammaproteobacteria bacterium]